METTSLWHAISDREKFETFAPLTEEIEVDVAIIGGGITGMTTALHLINAGKKVALVEAYRIGDGTTGNSTGNLYIATAPYYQTIAKKFSLDVAKAIAHSRKKAIDEIANHVREFSIDCNFSRRPWYIFTQKENNFQTLDKEVETYKKMEIEIDYIRSLPLPFKFKKAAFISNQARFNPLKYLQGLAGHLKKRGCLIYENTRAIDIREHDCCVVTTRYGKIKAEKTVVATHTPKGINPLQLFTAPYRSYVIAIHLKDENLPEGHYWGIDPEEYISSTHAIASQNPEVLLVAGSHHKTGQYSHTNTHFEAIDRYIKKLFPVHHLEHRWSAQHYQSADGVPYIGLATKSSRRVYTATGYFADGLIYGTIAGRVLSELINKGQDKIAEIYNSTRSTHGASLGFIAKENINVFLQYLKDLPWRSPKKYEDIKAGEGRIVEIKGEKCAVSRSANNQLHIVSAVCTHMKCIVNWNNAERTWDCPCHGSRFSQEGKVLEGPALADLEQKHI